MSRRTLTEGVVKSVLYARHYGFLALPDGSEAFLHRDDLARGLRLADLRPGDRVACTVRDTPKGLRASSVRRLGARQEVA